MHWRFRFAGPAWDLFCKAFRQPSRWLLFGGAACIFDRHQKEQATLDLSPGPIYPPFAAETATEQYRDINDTGSNS